MINLDNLIKELGKDEQASFIEIKEILKNQKLKRDKITFFYPGCGDDLINPLIFSGALLSCNKIDFVLLDVEMFDIIKALSSINLNAKLNVKKSKDKIKASFKLGNKEINIIHYSMNALGNWPIELGNGFDVYFERAFDVCRRDDPFFVKRVLNAINKEGFLISDCGFYDEEHIKKNNFREIKVPASFGFYNNLRIYAKK